MTQTTERALLGLPAGDEQTFNHLVDWHGMSPEQVWPGPVWDSHRRAHTAAHVFGHQHDHIANPAPTKARRWPWLLIVLPLAAVVLGGFASGAIKRQSTTTNPFPEAGPAMAGWDDDAMSPIVGLVMFGEDVSSGPAHCVVDHIAAAIDWAGWEALTSAGKANLEAAAMGECEVTPGPEALD